MEIYSTKTFEKLKIRPVDVNSISSSDKYHYFPENKKELRETLLYLIDRRGNDGNFNDIYTRKITDMSYLFEYLDEFKGDISEWDVSNVTNMCGMFLGCEKFNCPLNSWDVSKVRIMSYMFKGCSKFNQPLNKWKVENVKEMNSMFQYCEQFDQDLSSWDLQGKDYDYMLLSCPISTEYMPKNAWR